MSNPIAGELGDLVFSDLIASAAIPKAVLFEPAQLSTGDAGTAFKLG